MTHTASTTLPAAHCTCCLLQHLGLPPLVYLYLQNRGSWGAAVSPANRNFLVALKERYNPVGGASLERCMIVSAQSCGAHKRC